MKFILLVVILWGSPLLVKYYFNKGDSIDEWDLFPIVAFWIIGFIIWFIIFYFL